jgi:D-3-phosphoglycerate dehydrogenase / 2-oxoglutarate reductase
MGSIGSRVARLGSAFNMTVLGYSRTKKNLADFVQLVDIEALFRRADIVVLACSLNPDTRSLVNADKLALMKSTALIVNVSRGPVLVTSALVEALKSQRLGGAALDVFDAQPLALSSPLLDCPNLILSPHIAGITSTSMRKMGVDSVKEMLRILSGQAALNPV